MTRKEWDERWWEIYRSLIKAGVKPDRAFVTAHRRMNSSVGPRPPEDGEAGPPIWVKILAPLAGVEMGFISKIWEWLNGKKTVIGAVITIVALVADQLGVLLPLLGVEGVLVAKIVGGFTLVLGIAHKIYKFLYKEEHP